MWFDAADRIVHAVWRSCFLLLGLFNRAARDTGVSTGAPVLVVAPHPDDEALGCGVAISRHRRLRDPVTVAIVTDGGQAKSATPAERAVEAGHATQALGVACVMLGLPEGRWATEDGVNRLRQLLEQEKPAIVYAPSYVDYHPEHARVASALATALEGVAGATIVRVYEIGVPLTPVLVNCVLEADNDASEKRAALAAYVSQKQTIRAIERLHRYHRVLYRRRNDVELFWEMSARDYVQSVRWMENNRHAPFHGVRGRSFRDPLCYLIGLSTRRQLARAVAVHS